MITGFNTDIQYEGVTYHVQTEDKGLDTPIILSLVYVGGAILASKRAPYDDLIESGFDEKVLTERLQRQHKLICAAIKAGRVEDLKRMNERDPPARPAPAPADKKVVPEAPAKSARKKQPAAPAPVEAVEPPEAPPAAEAEPSPPVLDFEFDTSWYPEPKSEEPAPEPAVPEPEPEYVEEVKGDEGAIYLTLLDDEGDFRAGQLATIRVYVGRGPYGQRVVPDAEVTIKVLGTTFRPLIMTTRTDEQGVAVIRALLPRFTSGRAALIIRASADEDGAEMRRIIHQS